MKASYNVNAAIVTVTLSERNLLALLAQLRDPSRAAPGLHRRGLSLNEPTVLVQAQTDEQHYEGREAPGVMRVGTEALIVEVREDA